MDKRALIQAALQTVSSSTREAAVRWNLQSLDPDQLAFRPIGHQHPGVAALMATDQVLLQYEFPMGYQTRLGAFRRSSGAGPHGMTEGSIDIHVRTSTLSGVDTEFTVPVMVREGHVIEPVCMRHDGRIAVLSQDTIDNLINKGTFSAQVPDRPNIFSPPPSERREPRTIPLIRPGLFGFAPGNHQIGASIKSALLEHQTGIATPAHKQAVSDDPTDYRQPAERPQPRICPGDRIGLKKEVDVPGRDGQIRHLSKGTEGEVIRDMDGTGASLYVFVPSEGCYCVLPEQILERRGGGL